MGRICKITPDFMWELGQHLSALLTQPPLAFLCPPTFYFPSPSFHVEVKFIRETI